MNDVAPAIYEGIMRDFTRYTKENRIMRKVAYKADKGTATWDDAYNYGVEIADCLQRAFKKNITEEALPDGHMYYNIAERTVRPALEAMENMTRELSKKIMDGYNEKAGIGMKAI